MNIPLTKVLLAAVLTGLLSACAVPDKPPVAGVPQIPLETLLNTAAAAYSEGRGEKALELLNSAGMAYPADKAPWIKLAQMNFDNANYGEAIIHALKALSRDPDDKVAHSVIAVSGLRLSTKALAELRSQNELSGTVRSEAQELAKTLRENIGEAVLIPAPRPAAATKGAVRTQPKHGRSIGMPVQSVAAPASEPNRSSDPFGALK